MTRLLLLLLLLCPGSSRAIDSLVVGVGGRGVPWDEIIESAVYVGVAPDSVWTWPAARGEELAGLALARGGRIRLKQTVEGFSGPEDVLAEVPGLERWVDGEAATAWGPDETSEIPRALEAYLDLGGAFWVNRVRLAPRLDSGNRDRILGAFRLGGAGGPEPPTAMLDLNYGRLASFSESFLNRESEIDLRFAPRLLRYLRLVSEEDETWELADLEVFAAGGVAPAEVVSRPLFVRGAFPVWGRVLADGEDITDLPLRVQTRTGPDDEPLHYFAVIGDETERVSEEEYRRIGIERPEFGSIVVEQGPVLPNPEWSPWQTVSDGRVLSPGPRRYMQFRLGMAEAGTRVKRLMFEYISRPIVDELMAEINPLTVEPGAEIEFTLSVEVRLDVGRGDTGLRFLEVQTPAEVVGVDSVWVDDRPVVFSARPLAGGGFVLDLWRRVLQEGSFLQVRFRARVFRDGTQFTLRALDLRPEDAGLEAVYQSAREGDVEPLLVGGQLAVRLAGGRRPVVDLLRPLSAVITPNGDGINDVFEVEFNLLKLVREVPVRLEVFDLDGRRVYADRVESSGSGAFARVWDGRTAEGGIVSAGVYLFRIRATTDGGERSVAGVVRVVY